MRIVFCGGGTGGHTFPIIAIIRELKKSSFSSNLEFFYIGPKDSFLENLIKKGVKVKTIKAGKIRRYITPVSVFSNFLNIFKIAGGCIQAYLYLGQIKPRLIFSKGGYGSLPVVLAGSHLDIPIFLHESDTIPGWTNRITAKYAKRIFLAFPQKYTKGFPKKIPQNRFLFVGNPIREEITKGDKEAGKKIFNLTDEKPVLLILGGSQGAQRINDVILLCLLDILKLFEVIHQCGKNNLEEMELQTKVIFQKNEDLKKYYHLYGFLDEEKLKHAYKVADLVISRAGAGSIFEILANGLPSILVPLPESAQNHQRENAYLIEKFGASLVIEQTNFKPHFLLKKLYLFFSKPELLKEMRKKAKKLAIPNSAKLIAKYILEELGFIDFKNSRPYNKING
ncbi:MAG: undecaprenyldiphospho-muramoylpentapeptide beta-N-acetylglucosaminyltransferase [Candidatus Pacebacteria bacterium]|nr:undecaprenyldiphospho-muramoylpentapeptide beta-N-acetylglucosaminyltransferase [Candidatus Paceibacterota bacterium]